MPNLLDYTGAGSRLTPEAGLALPHRRWAWQPKVDGCYARVSTDRAGRAVSILARDGRPLKAAAGLLGIVAGPPNAVLHGELEAHTEAGIRAAATRGWAALHLFDLTRLHGASIEALPYGDRYGRLHAAQAALECDGVGRVTSWGVDEQGDAHSNATGRYCRQVPRDLRRFPIVPMARGKGAGEALWRSFVEVGGGEGLVAVRLDAPARGSRGAKRKIKATDTIDCVVLSVEPRHAMLSYGGQRFVVSAASKKTRLVAGQVVEVAHDGWYERGATPRFARVLRVRTDITAAT